LRYWDAGLVALGKLSFISPGVAEWASPIDLDGILGLLFSPRRVAASA